MKQYDLIVLGTGGAGYKAAIKCKEAGWTVAVVNEGLFGGTCSVRGCIPKKVLAGAAEIANINRRLGEVGIVTKQPVMSWGGLIKFKRTFTDPVPESTEKALRDAGIDVFIGSPRFIGDLQIEVDGQQLQAKKVHIAVGAKPAKLPIAGFEHFITSDDFLELDELPKRVLFVGGGYISFEFAHVAASFGADVTILHSDDHPLPIFDQDVVHNLLEVSKEAGIEIELQAEVKAIRKENDGFAVVSADGRSFEADVVIHGVGRPPAVAELNLESTGVDYDKHRGILVDEYLRSTSNPHVYAAGDAAADGPPLSPVAGVQGDIVAENLLGGKHKQPSYLSTPSVIFTTPGVAKVGYLEDEARQKNIKFDTTTQDLTSWFDAKRLNLKHTMSKVLVEKKTGKIIGAHLIANHAEDLINIFSLAIELGLTAEQLKTPISAFPTTSDDMRAMF